MRVAPKLVVVLAMATAACDAIPALEFDAPDSASEGSSPVGAYDSAAAPPDATIKDASSSPDAGRVDAAPPPPKPDGAPPPPDSSPPPPDAAEGCPDTLPPGATWCCAAVPCRGDAGAICQAACTNCENDCAGRTCCLNSEGNFVGCASTALDCP